MTVGEPRLNSKHSGRFDGLTRRGFIAGAATLAAARPVRAQTSLRIAAVDWAMLETTLALGVTPVAATELKLFRRGAVEPHVPPEVADLGLRGEINAEMLLLSRPDLVLISPWYDKHRGALARVAPLESFSIYEPGRPPYAPSQAATRRLGALLSLERQAEALIAEAEAAFSELGGRLARFRARPFLVANFGDARHFRAFGADSMFADVLGRLGLRSAWDGGSAFAAIATVGLEALAEMPDAWIVVLGPTPPGVMRGLGDSPFWRAMPQVAAGRVLELAPVNPFGALPAAMRFARLFAHALEGRDHA